MQIQLVRSATVRVSMAGVVLLIDPWLAAKGEGRSYAGDVRSPLVDLPMPVEAVVDGVDAVLVSHLHSDHFDAAAARAMGLGDVPLICAQELDIEGAMPLCIRVLVHLSTTRTRSELRHVYLEQARSLRDDLPE